MSLRLIVDSGHRKQRFPLIEGANQLGSSPNCSVRIVHPSVSRRHALIHVNVDGAEVEDTGSRNGTRVAGVRVTGHKRKKLAVGEVLTLGAVSTVLEEVSVKDLEPAVRFRARSSDPISSAEHEAGGVLTGTIGTARTFALEKLPDLLTLLASRCGVTRMSQAVGAALFETLPCLALEIVSAETEGVLFRGRHADDSADEEQNQAVVSNGHIRISVALAHPTHAKSYAPLLETGSLLIQLAADADPLVSPAAVAARSPLPLPEPATVVPEVRKIYSDAARVSQGNVSVLVRGASGTGKEVLARFLHESSPRAPKPFVALNCAALPRDLLESELFGIEQGVATGVSSRPGKFEMAAGGTLFLDEIGDMALETQARILRVLQEGEVHRLGSREPRSADVRVVAASHRDLDAMLQDGSFRSDLYHRIADWTVRLPTLRERRADIANLAAFFLEREIKHRGLKVAGISRGAMDLLEAYEWPGNIRQLEREMSRAALFLERGELLESSHLQEAIRCAEPSVTPGLKERLEQVERREIQQALAGQGWSVQAAARELRIGLSTLYRRMRELGIEPEG